MGCHQSSIGDSWLGCLSYNSRPYYLIDNAVDKYWVKHTNNAPSFDQCKVGPPSLSEPIVNHAIEAVKLFNICTEYVCLFSKEINIKINAAEQNLYCDGNLEGTLPFISVGSQYGAGNPSYITTMNDRRLDKVLHFKMEVKDYTAFTCDEPACLSFKVSCACRFICYY